MLKIRLQGTLKDIKWFLKIVKTLNRDGRFYMNTPSEPLQIKGTRIYKRVFLELYRDYEEFLKGASKYDYKGHGNNDYQKKNRYTGTYYGSGTKFG